jgi:hypothetical protein
MGCCEAQGYAEAHLAGIMGGQVYFPCDEKTADMTNVNAENA